VVGIGGEGRRGGKCGGGGQHGIRGSGNGPIRRYHREEGKSHHQITISKIWNKKVIKVSLN